MNREIKFRVFDYKTLRIYYSDSGSPSGGYLAEECKKLRTIVFSEHGDITGVSLEWGGYGSGREFTEFTYQDEDKLKIMQYTGFKDKKGTEIYEGDICQGYWAIRSDGVYATYGHPFLIKDMRFIDDYISYSDGSGRRYNLYIEVIGNIYENPQLLKIS